MVVALATDCNSHLYKTKLLTFSDLCDSVLPTVLAMAAANHKLAVIIKNPLDKEEFLLKKQTPPPKFNDPEDDSFVDTDLWDLPSTQLTPLSESDQLLHSKISIKTREFSSSDKINLSEFDFNSALNQVYFLSPHLN